MPRLLTQAQYARKTKYSRARISQLVKQKVIILKNGKVDPAQAQAAIAANIDRSRRMKLEKKAEIQKSPQMELIPNAFNIDQKRSPSPSAFNTEQSTSLTDARRDHELLKIKLTELQYQIRKGELVYRNQAIDWGTLMVGSAKAYLMGLPKRWAGLLASITDPKEILDITRKDIRTALEEISKALKKAK